MAEIRDLKVFLPQPMIRSPVSGCLCPYLAAEWWPRVGARLRRALGRGVAPPLPARRSREGVCWHGDMGARGDGESQGETGNRIGCCGPDPT
jgi:hypothetical protein